MAAGSHDDELASEVWHGADRRAMTAPVQSDTLSSRSRRAVPPAWRVRRHGMCGIAGRFPRLDYYGYLIGCLSSLDVLMGSDSDDEGRGDRGRRVHRCPPDPCAAGPWL
ncbi:hypothetical protein FRAHR75_130100 [Frankia sp. Hr75.2]|nr:hypothetical protein FRAHR75_130100 [Frankia sp. Hr75.2]SQD96339.1 hypothetical protein FMEAI12_3580034 [Parafrankia sp. Ea1.12]